MIYVHIYVYIQVSRHLFFLKNGRYKTGIGEDPQILESLHVWVFDPGFLGWDKVEPQRKSCQFSR